MPVLFLDVVKWNLERSFGDIVKKIQSLRSLSYGLTTGALLVVDVANVP